MARLDVDESAIRFGVRGVIAVGFITEPSACGVGTKFVMEGALQDDDFFATGVDVGIELSIRLPFNEGDTLGSMLMEGHDGEAVHHALSPRLVALF